MKLCTALANDDASSVNHLTGEHLYSKPLGIGIAPILGGAATFGL
jgi:hypothetical protein